MKAVKLSWVAASLLGAAAAQAGMVTDQHGNVGFDTLEECEAAVRSGSTKFYQSFTKQPPLLRAGERSVKVMKLSEAPLPGFSGQMLGVCDKGVGRKLGRDGVSAKLQGKYVPYGPDFAVNVYYNQTGEAVRVTMQQCDNWFSGNFPQAPIKVAAAPAPEPVVTVAPAPAPEPVAVAPAPVPEPVVAPAPEPVAVAPAPEPVVQPAPVVELAPAAEPVVGATATLSTGAWVALGVVAAGVLSVLADDNSTPSHTTTPGHPQ